MTLKSSAYRLKYGLPPRTKIRSAATRRAIPSWFVGQLLPLNGAKRLPRNSNAKVHEGVYPDEVSVERRETPDPADAIGSARVSA